MATKTIVRYRTRRVRSRRRSNNLTIPIAPLAGLAVGVVPAIQLLAQGKANAAMSDLVYSYTGWRTWDNSWSYRGLMRGLLPLAIGGMVHKVGNRLGINRALSSAGIPFIRI